MVQGGEMKSLDSVALSPADHIEANLRFIAASIGVPYRIFIGTEEGKLAGGQDAVAWLRRVSARQENYATPFIIRLFVDRMIQFGVLPEVEEYEVVWPDLFAPSDKDISENADKASSAMAKYVSGSVDQLITPKQFFMTFFKMDETQAEAIEKEALAFTGLDDDDDDNDNQPAQEDEDEDE